MIEFLHILGVCPDSLNHIDLIDIIITNYNQIQLLIYNLLNNGKH